MKNSTAYVLFIVLLLGIALWSQVSRPRRFVWMPTYSHYDTQPFGCAVFDSVLSFSLPQGYEVINKPLFVLGREDTARVRNVLVVSNGVELGMNERDTLFRMLERGAKVMLVATWIDSDLEDTLGVHFAMQEFSDVVSEGTELLPPCDTLYWAGGAGGYPERRFTVRSDFMDDGVYMMDVCMPDGWEEYWTKPGHFTRRVWAWQHAWMPGDTSRVRPVAVSFPVGKGELFWVQTPRLFTNYGILDDDHRAYVFRLLNLLKDAPVVRTEVYGDSYEEFIATYDSHGPFDYVLSQPPLRWAFYVVLVTLAFFFCFTARRRQRPVPLLPSPANKSLEFVKLIGTLYFQRETPTELVRKKWLYFADEVQRHTGIDLRDQATAQERVSRLSEKTGMAQEDLLPLLTRLDEVLGESARRPDNEEMKRLVDRMNDVLRRL